MKTLAFEAATEHTTNTQYNNQTTKTININLFTKPRGGGGGGVVVVVVVAFVVLARPLSQTNGLVNKHIFMIMAVRLLYCVFVVCSVAASNASVFIALFVYVL